MPTKFEVAKELLIKHPDKTIDQIALLANCSGRVVDRAKTPIITCYVKWKIKINEKE